MFAEAIEDILRDQCTPAVVRAIEGGDPGQPLWDAISQAGFLDLLRSEDDGGAALQLADLYAIVVQFGRYAAPLPFAQSIAARALVAPGVSLPAGPLSLAPTLQRLADGRLQAPLVPFGTVAGHVLSVDEGQLVLMSTASAECQRTGIAHSQFATLVWPDDRTLERIAGDAAALLPMAAAVQSALLVGVLTRVLEMSLQYCNERSQFGRSLGKFQVVQHQLAVMAEQVAAAAIASEAAFQGEGRIPRLLRAAMAKARTSEAAPEIANAAHALYGAIGVTEEFDLQLYTRRLHEGRLAHGAENYWNRIVGEALLATDTTLAEFVRAA